MQKNNLLRRQCICQRQMGSQAVLPRATFKLHIAQIRSNLPNRLKKSKFLGFDDNQVSFVNRSKCLPTQKNLSFRSVTWYSLGMPCAGPELSELCLLNYESFVLLFNLKWFQQLPFSPKECRCKEDWVWRRWTKRFTFQCFVNDHGRNRMTLK